MARGWGKGGMVGIRKAIWQQNKVREQAARILAEECGTRHKLGTRADLCPKCKEAERRERGGE